MEQQQSVSVASSWNVQGPYAISSILQSQCKDECSYESTPTSTHSIKLVPPLSAANDDNNHQPPCQLVLSSPTHHEVVSIDVVSSARHVELYDSQDSYCFTTRGSRQAAQEDDQETNTVLYMANLIMDSSVPHCRLKFVSLSDKCQLTLSRLMVTYQKTQGDSQRGGMGGQSIDMVKVREIMDSLQQPVPSNVENLMQTVEQYQKNQASVLNDFHQAATDRLLTSSNDPKASLAANMAGVLSAFSKASSLQQTAVTFQPTAAAQASRASPSENVSAGSTAASAELTTEGLSKLMLTFGLQQQPPTQRDNTETNGSESSPDMLSALRMMCRDVSHMRAADRQTANRSNVEGHESNTENTRQKDNSSVSHWMGELEQRLMGYIAASEERIVTRLQQQMNVLQEHIDSRFDKIESLLQAQRDSVSENASTDCALISEEVD